MSVLQTILDVAAKHGLLSYPTAGAFRAELSDMFPQIDVDGEVIVTVGLPRSGKTTWAKSTGLPIVSPDAIRKALHGHRFYAPSETLVWAHAVIMARSLLLGGCPKVVVDATHMTVKRRKLWLDEFPGKVSFVMIPTPLETCLQRAAGDPAIQPVIRRMAEQYEPLSGDELNRPGQTAIVTEKPDHA